ncbi:DUF1737 domain-containing protein [Thalassotalea euphylliae]|uniref:DUF1737 domain-containing protein n=1 Tax=Thalassotalea euphylliae TaxID=1655234 RepID=UPI00362D15A5
MQLYRFITGPDDATFCMRISTLLNQGWTLQGNPTLTYNGETTIAGQALIKEVPGQTFHQDIDLTAY